MPSLLPFNPALEHLPVYHPGRPIDEVARELGLDPAKVLKVASNENPLGPSPAALAAMERALRDLHLYPDGNAFHLKNKLAQHLQLAPNNIVLGNGSNEIIEFVGHALMKPGTNIVVSQFCFAIYPIIAHLFGAEVITVPAKNHGHDLEAMLHAVTPETRVLFVANPNNPTGTLASTQAVRHLIDHLPPGVLLVMDEAYIEFIDRPADLLPLIRSNANQQLLLMRTFSKIHGLAGLRIGYGIAHPELIAALEKIRQPFNVNALAQAGALAALDDQEHLERTRANNQAGLKVLQDACQKLGLEYVPSFANFLLVRVGDGQRIFAELQKQGIITRPMAGYKLPEWIRISIGTPHQIQACIEALTLIC